MASSFSADFLKTITARATLIVAALLASAILHAGDTNSYIIAARRGGAIEIIDPSTLATIGRIHFDVPSKSTGLNAISASADGTKLYVEGPIPRQNGCCALYSIDLGTMETTQVAGVGAVNSRSRFFAVNGVTYQFPLPNGTPTPFPVGTAGIYDPVQGKFVDFVPPSGFGPRSSRNGVWVDGRFIFYALKDGGSDARLWSLSPGSNHLDEGPSVEPFAKVPGCSSAPSAQIGLAAAAGNIFLYEMFGWIGDRRIGCSGVPGGLWVADPSSGELVAHVAPDLYFSELVTDAEKDELYGISVDDPNWRSGVKLLRIDAQDGAVLKSRVLEDDFWRLAFARLRTVPAADVRALIYVKQ